MNNNDWITNLFIISLLGFRHLLRYRCPLDAVTEDCSDREQSLLLGDGVGGRYECQNQYCRW